MILHERIEALLKERFPLLFSHVGNIRVVDVHRFLLLVGSKTTSHLELHRPSLWPAAG